MPLRGMDGEQGRGLLLVRSLVREVKVRERDREENEGEVREISTREIHVRIFARKVASPTVLAMGRSEKGRLRGETFLVSEGREREERREREEEIRKERSEREDEAVLCFSSEV